MDDKAQWYLLTAVLLLAGYLVMLALIQPGINAAPTADAPLLDDAEMTKQGIEDLIDGLDAASQVSELTASLHHFERVLAAHGVVADLDGSCGASVVTVDALLVRAHASASFQVVQAVAAC